MRILAFNQGHDISSVCLDGGKLIFSHEAEKDNGERHTSSFNPLLLINSFKISGLPDVIAHAGWHKQSDHYHASTDAGYFGIGNDSRVAYIDSNFERELHVFSCSHERSHIMCSYGMSDFPQGQPCYALVWEGSIGAFYYVDKDVTIHKIGNVLPEVGNKYAFLYALADPTMPEWSTYVRISDAGKLMALAAYGNDSKATKDELDTIKAIMDLPTIYGYPHKASMKNSKYFNIGLENEAFKNLAKKFSNAIFNKFYEYARQHLDEKLPLIISGGCGLNCDWNSQWKSCGLFTDVFVPPCTNDSGVALGAAIDAQFFYTGNAKIEWNVYAGDYFLNDIKNTITDGFQEFPLNVSKLCEYLADDKVFAWAQGRAEMGPRALGNRSLLAAPFNAEMKERLNKIKFRENFRPIAPVCLLDEMGKYFDNQDNSPYMLFFQRVHSTKLGAVTHVDGTARAQTVRKNQNPELYNLLTEFKNQTGCGVLCNTSLNFPGRGFINRLSDLAEYAKKRELDGFVVSDKMYLSNAIIHEKDIRKLALNTLDLKMEHDKQETMNYNFVNGSLLTSLKKRGQFKLDANKKNSHDKGQITRYIAGTKKMPGVTVEVIPFEDLQFVFRIIVPIAKNSKDKLIQEFCDSDSIIQQLLGDFYTLALTKSDQISLVLQSQVNANELADKLDTHFEIMNKVVFNFHERLKIANLSQYVLESNKAFFWG